MADTTLDGMQEFVPEPVPEIVPEPVKKPRAPKGSGSCFFSRPKNCWVARKWVNKRRVEKTGRTRLEAIQRLYSSVPSVPPPQSVPAAAPSSNMTLSEWCDYWLPTLCLDLKPQSIDSYESAIRLRIKPDLGHFPLSALTAFDVECAARVWVTGTGARERVDASTARKTITILSACLQAATRADALSRNVARVAKKPRVAPKAAIDPFTKDQLRAITEAAQERDEWRIFGACAATGCRIGEVLALTPESYNAATGKLSITATQTRRYGIGSPKSARSARTIGVPPVARVLFEGGIPSTSYPTARRRWKCLLHHLKLRYRNPHQLRHSVASHLIADGVPFAEVAAYLGDTMAVLLRTYVHTTSCEAPAALDRLLSPAPTNGAVPGAGAGA